MVKISRVNTQVPGGIQTVFYIDGQKKTVDACLLFDRAERQWVMIRYIPISTDSATISSYRTTRLDCLLQTGWGDADIEKALVTNKTYVTKSDLIADQTGGQQ